MGDLESQASGSRLLGGEDDHGNGKSNRMLLTTHQQGRVVSAIEL
jgi:hypothetical protein